MLTWGDFKGDIPLSELNSIVTRATCVSKITVYPVLKNDSTQVYKVRVVFNKFKSWTRDTTRYVLAHEQLHFDIKELYCRKLRRVIKERFKGEYGSKFGEAVKALIAESNVQEKVYDRETIHGAFKEGQHEWAKRINEELEQLKEYASTLKDCN